MPFNFWLQFVSDLTTRICLRTRAHWQASAKRSLCLTWSLEVIMTKCKLFQGVKILFLKRINLMKSCPYCFLWHVLIFLIATSRRSFIVYFLNWDRKCDIKGICEMSAAATSFSCTVGVFFIEIINKTLKILLYWEESKLSRFST